MKEEKIELMCLVDSEIESKNNDILERIQGVVECSICCDTIECPIINPTIPKINPLIQPIENKKNIPINNPTINADVFLFSISGRTILCI